MAPTEEAADFRASDLIGSAGIAGNGEKLVNTLEYHYPPELQAALLRRENVSLTSELDESDYAAIAEIAGVERIENAKVRGGERHSDDAFVTYAYIDEKSGDVVKGCFPYPDLGSSSSEKHISQRDSILQSPAARDHLAAQAKADKAPSGDVEALRAQVEELSARLGDQTEPKPAAPIEGNATEIAEKLKDADRVTAEAVLDFEVAHEQRKTVTRAAAARIEAIDSEESEAQAERQRLEEENERLKARVAELEAAPASGGNES